MRCQTPARSDARAQRLLVERLLGCEQVASRRPGVRATARDLAIAQMLGGPTRVRGRLLQFPGRRVEQLRGGLQPLLSLVLRHQSIFIATCLSCVYSSIE